MDILFIEMGMRYVCLMAIIYVTTMILLLNQVVRIVLLGIGVLREKMIKYIYLCSVIYLVER